MLKARATNSLCPTIPSNCTNKPAPSPYLLVVLLHLEVEHIKHTAIMVRDVCRGHLWEGGCACVCMCVCVCERGQVCVSACAYVHMYVCVYVCVCVCARAYV